MYPTIQRFHEQFEVVWKVAQSQDLPFDGKKISQFYLAGMGGSSLPGDLVNDYLKGQVELKMLRSYDLPDQVSQNNLVFCCSYSGNTEETLAVLDKVLERKIPVIILTHGGILREKALNYKLPLLEIPECIQPRMAIGYFFGGIVGIFERLGMISSQKDCLEALSRFLFSVRGSCEEKGKELAQSLKDRVPIIYGPCELEGMCRIWKIKMNENVKIASFHNVFPELNHNEMVGWTKLMMQPAFIFLKSQWMHSRIHKRMDVMKKILGTQIPIYTVGLQGSNLLEEMFYGVLLADYCTYHLAQAYGVDPVSVEMVEEFKRCLKK